MASNRDILVAVEADTAGLRRDLANAERVVAANVGAMRRKLNDMDKAMREASRSAKQLAGSLIGGWGLAALSREIVQVNKSFQDLKSGLATVMGSQEAGDAAFKSIRQFAQETPYDLQEVTTSFIKLKALGLDPGTEALRAYGDIAAAIPGKSLVQFVDAVTDAAMGQYKALKDFGVQAKAQGDQVAFTFRGVTEVVKKNSKEIETYLQKIASTNFGGGMADKMKLLSGVTSNLKDSLDNLFVTIGEAGANDALIRILRGLQKGLETTTAHVDDLGRGLQVTLGAAAGYGAARVVTAVLPAMRALVADIGAVTACLRGVNAAGSAATASLLTTARASNTAAISLRALKAVMSFFGGPLGLALTAAAGAVTYFATRQTDAEIAAKRFAESQERLNDAVEKIGTLAKRSAGEVKGLTEEQKRAAEAEEQRIIEGLKLKNRKDIESNEKGITETEKKLRISSTGAGRGVENAINMGREPDALDSLATIQRQYRAGAISADEYSVAVSKLAEKHTWLTGAAEQVRDLADKLGLLRRQGAKLREDKVALSNGKVPGAAEAEEIAAAAAAKKAADDAAEAEAARQASIDKATATLEFERAQLRRNAKEQAAYNALKRAGIEDTDAAAASVIALSDALYEETKAKEDQKKNEQGQKKIKEYIASLKEQTGLLTLDGIEREKANAILEIENSLKADGIKLSEAQRDELEHAIEQRERLKETVDKQREAEQDAKQMGISFTSSITSGMEDAIVEGKKLSEVFKALEKDIAKLILRAMVLKPLEDALGGASSKWFGKLGGGGGGGGGSAPAVQSVDGDGASVLEVQGFAAGGSPPLHRVSLVGERGPELFVPRVPGTVIPNDLLQAPKREAVNYAPVIQVDARGSTLSEADIRAITRNAVDQSVAKIRDLQARYGSSRV